MDRKLTRELDPLLKVDLDSEWYLGATNINGAIGNGRLTAGISLWGEITVLRWPRVSHFDQIRYRTAHGFPFHNYRVRLGSDAPCASYRRWGRPRLLSDNMGSFGGIFIPGGGRTTWFHEPSWDSEKYPHGRWQEYQPQDTNILLSKAYNKELDITVEITDLIAQDIDVLARHFRLKCGPGSPEGEAFLIYFANSSPSKTRARYYPVTWRLQERRSDYLAVYNPGTDTILHFRPDAAKPSNARATASRLQDNPEAIEGYVDGLDSDFPGGGIYLAWGGDIPSVGFQVGRNGTAGKGGVQRDAYVDGSSGLLSNCPAALRPANGALSFKFYLAPDKSVEMSVFIAVSDRARRALELIDRSRKEGFEPMLDRTAGHWSRYISVARVPHTGDALTNRVARRSILALGVGTDSQSGAIVASISRQPQYCFDWTRDGAFFDCALDMAGYHSQATKHVGFYLDVQLERDRLTKKRGEFEGNYYTDGETGPIPFVEIDETGLAAWNLWRHARYLHPAQRDQYLSRVYPAVRLAADALLSMRRHRGGLQRRAHEDDNIFRRTSTLHGTSSTYLGLRSAVEAGKQTGEDREKVSEWAGWAEELQQAVKSCYDPEARKFRREGWRGRSWIIWPADTPFGG